MFNNNSHRVYSRTDSNSGKGFSGISYLLAFILIVVLPMLF